MTPRQYLLLAVMAAVVILLRFLPFLLFGGKRPVPELFVYLGKTLSAAAISMLVVYSLSATTGASSSGGALSLFVSSFSVIVLQRLFRNPLLSISVGTVLYMLSVQGFWTKLPFF